MPVKSLNIDLLPVLRKLPFVEKGLLISGTVGGYKSVFKGRGLEFEDYRVYGADDDSALIDWKATARAGKTLIREYIEERNLNVMFLFDVSNSMLFGSTEKLKIEYAAELIAALSHAILEAGDNVGIVLFTDKIMAKLYPNRGNKQYYAISRILKDPKNYGGNLDIEDVSKYILSTFKETALIILVSDFVGFESNWEKYLEFMSAKFEMIGVMVKDPRDISLPEDSGQVVIQDPYSRKQLLIETDIVKKAYENLMRKQIRDVKYKFLKLKTDVLELETNKSFVNPLIKFFKKRGSERR
ncbi:hypothetical protein CL617_01685 [archaeon]|nr:hypothetical protein [archaeon]|tara:strand:- start:2556 stop:3449 length:894 start_codon:yes stop_codon:yes gene_type:complete